MLLRTETVLAKSSVLRIKNCFYRSPCKWKKREACHRSRAKVREWEREREWMKYVTLHVWTGQSQLRRPSQPASQQPLLYGPPTSSSFFCVCVCARVRDYFPINMSSQNGLFATPNFFFLGGGWKIYFRHLSRMDDSEGKSTHFFVCVCLPRFPVFFFSW